MVWGTGNFKSCDSLLKRVEQNDPALQELVILPMKSFESQDMERLASIIGKIVTFLLSILISTV